MNFIISESQEDFPSERLPTLNFDMWLSEGRVYHSYYQKEMRASLVIMERSTMTTDQKFQILSNEFNRCVSNIQHSEIEKSEINEKWEQFTRELKSSGYNQKQAHEIVCNTVCGWRNRVRKRKRQNISFYRLAEETKEEQDEERDYWTEQENW